MLATFGLLIVAALTVVLLTGRLPFGGRPAGSGGVIVPPDATPAPSNVVVVPDDPRAEVPGTIAYVKQGSLWLQTGTTVRQLTAGADDTNPAWSADGDWIYFIRTVTERGLWPNENGRPAYYTMTYPVLMRIGPDGEQLETLDSGKFSRRNGLTWFYWLRQPTPNPVDPNQLAILSDQPDPTQSNVVLHTYAIAEDTFTRPAGPRETPPLGHQDPAWRFDGKVLLYVMNDRDGRRGAPTIWRWDPAGDRVSRLSGPGYLAPAWSPDAKYVAATKTGPFGTDVVVLDAATGGEVARITSDGDSWSPSWSPRGDAIAYLHVNGQIVDLRMSTIEPAGSSFEVTDTIDLTIVSGLDGASRPSWFIPPDELPPPSPSPSPAASPSASGAGSPSAGASPSP
jgi:dipeptidyl aminopeptidase/acylaminoacyl peptidase